ncbi:MAG TPA: HEPN domain-containing protein [Planctomycetota bacterium]|nr:HEPN domain-containing protein [Planctomycetota bacterium]
MAGKARRTLKIALHLLEIGAFDDAASRMYYAAFQAAVETLRRQGRSPSDFRKGAKDWDHEMVGRNAALVRGLAQDGDLLRRLRELRERADYHERAVMRRDLEFLRPDVVRFVEEVSP